MLTPWFRYFLTYDPADGAAQSPLPGAGINGEKDLQVDPQQNLPLDRGRAQAGGEPRRHVRELPGLNHLFQHCQTGSPPSTEKSTRRCRPRRCKSSEIGSSRGRNSRARRLVHAWVAQEPCYDGNGRSGHPLVHARRFTLFLVRSASPRESAHEHRNGSSSSAAASPAWRPRIAWSSSTPRSSVILSKPATAWGACSKPCRATAFWSSIAPTTSSPTRPGPSIFAAASAWPNSLMPTSSAQRGAMVVHRGRLVRVPAGFMLMAPARLWPLVTTPMLSPLGKAAAAGRAIRAAPRRGRRRKPGRRSPGGGWDARPSSGSCSRWWAASTRPTPKSSACGPRCRGLWKWNAAMAA